MKTCVRCKNDISNYAVKCVWSSKYMNPEYYCELPINDSQLNLTYTNWGPCAIKLINDELKQREEIELKKKKNQEEKEKEQKIDIENLNKFMENEEDIVKVYVIEYGKYIMSVIAKNINDCAQLICNDFFCSDKETVDLLLAIYKSNKYELKNQDESSKLLTVEDT